MTDQKTSFANCPHLGLSGDASSVYMVPTAAHCCFGIEKIFSPEPSYQAQYCLTARHTACSLYYAPTRLPLQIDFELQEDGSWGAVQLSPENQIGSTAGHQSNQPQANQRSPADQKLVHVGQRQNAFPGVGDARLRDALRTVGAIPIIPPPPSQRQVNFLPLIWGIVVVMGLFAMFIYFNPAIIRPYQTVDLNRTNGSLPTLSGQESDALETPTPTATALRLPRIITATPQPTSVEEPDSSFRSNIESGSAVGSTAQKGGHIFSSQPRSSNREKWASAENYALSQLTVPSPIVQTEAPEMVRAVAGIVPLTRVLSVVEHEFRWSECPEYCSIMVQTTGYRSLCHNQKGIKEL